ncbi:MAG: ABC transporter substrate-binding protein [Fervidobacterium sp.]
MRKILIALILSLLVITIFGANEIVIGVTQPLTGNYAMGGQLGMRGIEMAHEEVQTVLGRPIKLLSLDNKSDKIEAANVVTRLIEQFKVVAILGTYSSALGIPGAEIANKNKVVYIAPSNTNPLVTKDKPFAFRVCFIDPFQGTVMAKFAVQYLKAKTAAVIYDVSNDYSVGLAYYFRDAFIKLTGNSKAVVSYIAYQGGDQDFTAQLTDIKKKNPDVIFVPAGIVGDAALIAKQARELGLKQPLLGGDTWDLPQLIEIGGAAVEGAYYSTMFDVKAELSPKTKPFVEKYRKKYNEDPGYLPALAYDAYMVLIDAIQRAKSDKPEDIRRALLTTDYVGVSGRIRFDQNRDAIKDAVIKTIKNGKFEFVTIIKGE